MSRSIFDASSYDSSLIQELQQAAYLLTSNNEFVSDIAQYERVLDLLWTLIYRLNTEEINETKTAILAVIDTLDKQYPGVKNHIVESAIWQTRFTPHRQ